jgi:hypothetical protein
MKRFFFLRPRPAKTLAEAPLKLLGFVLCIITVIPVHAERKPIAFGLLGGVNVASFYGDEVSEVEARVWPVTGFSLAFHLPLFLGLETELLYASRGGTYDTQGPEGDSHVHVLTAHTLTIPTLIKITAPTESETQPIFMVGPSFAFLVAKDFTSESIALGAGGLIAPEALEPRIPKGQLRDLDICLTVVGGLEWGLGTFQARVNLGQQTVDKRGEVDLKTITLDLIAGFIF